MTASRLFGCWQPLALAWAMVLAGGSCDQRADTPSVETTTTPSSAHRIVLRRRIFTPAPAVAPFLASGKIHGVLQFFERQPESPSRLRKLGITVHGSQRSDAYYVTVPDTISEDQLRAIGVRALFALLPTDKLSPSLWPRTTEWTDEIIISYASTVSRDDVTRTLAQLGGEIIAFEAPSLAHARLPSSAVSALAQRDFVWWIEPLAANIVPLLDEARVLLRADLVHAMPWGTAVPGLTGWGVNVAIWEADDGPDLQHPDFDDPIQGIRVFNGEPLLPGLHATQVAGALVGNGAGSASNGGNLQEWAGLAPEAVLFAFQVSDADLVGAEIAASFASNDTVVTNHSYGLGVDGPEDCANVGSYGAYSLAVDDATTVVPVTSTHGSGNEAMSVAQEGCEISVLDEAVIGALDPALVAAGFGTINGRATAKNTIAVGSRGKDLDIAPTSSRGPTRDGRVKPDVVAVGGTPEVPLTLPSTPTIYATNDGSSFAAPQVAGAAALLVEHYRVLENDPALAPDPALIKAVLLNTTQTLGAQGPRYSRGYGVLDIEAAVANAENFVEVVVLDGEQQTVPIPPGPPDACELRVMAVWTDPVPMMPSLDTLVNDVDLQVMGPEGVVLPWTLNPSAPDAPASRQENHVDNVEQVTLAGPTEGVVAILSGDIPIGSDQEVVVHWFHAPCDAGGDTDGAGSDDGGEAGCGSCSARPRSAPLALLLWIGALLLAPRRRWQSSRSLC